MRLLFFSYLIMNQTQLSVDLKVNHDRNNHHKVAKILQRSISLVMPAGACNSSIHVSVNILVPGNRGHTACTFTGPQKCQTRLYNQVCYVGINAPIHITFRGDIRWRMMVRLVTGYVRRVLQTREHGVLFTDPGLYEWGYCLFYDGTGTWSNSPFICLFKLGNVLRHAVS